MDPLSLVILVLEFFHLVVPFLVNLNLLFITLSPREAMIEAMKEVTHHVVGAFLPPSIEWVISMMIDLLRTEAIWRLRPVGGNSRLQAMATSATHGNGNGKLRNWLKADFLRSLDSMYKCITQCYTCLSMMMMMIITKTLDNGELKIHDNSWDMVTLLGKGSCGQVHKAITRDGRFFAVKVVLLTDQGGAGQESIDHLQQEISLLSQFQHEHIVQYYGSFKDKTKLCIFLELATEGSLLNLYKEHKLSYFQASEYTRQIVKGLKYLHEHNVVHRDIKCANILVHANGTVKLADFGLAKLCKLNDIKSCKGTPFWMAPEVVDKKKRKNNGYGFAADIWSLGCTVLEMLTQKYPYFELEPAQAIFQIGKGRLPNVPDYLMTDARYFIFDCLQVDPNKRPTAAQLLEYSFVRRQSQRDMMVPLHM